MFNSETVFVGLKIYRDTIDVALASKDHPGEDHFYGTISANLASLSKLVEKLRSLHSNLYFIYEAGNAGYDYYRFLSDQGLACDVIAPLPKVRTPHNHVDSYCRDALQLAGLVRDGKLTKIYVPRPEDEAIRNLMRCWGAARLSRRKARSQVQEFLNSSGFHNEKNITWSYEGFQELQELNFPLPAQNIAFKEYLDMASSAGQRLKRLEAHLENATKDWRLQPLVEAYQSLRGINFLAAVLIASELGDLRRFSNPRKLMAYVGLIPHKRFTGTRPHYGSNHDKSKNSLIADMLFEAAWSYSKPAGVESMITRLLTGQRRPVIEISRKAEVQLCSRYRNLKNEGKSHDQVLTIIARDILGYVWTIAQKVELSEFSNQ